MLFFRGRKTILRTALTVILLLVLAGPAAALAIALIVVILPVLILIFLFHRPLIRFNKKHYGVKTSATEIRYIRTTGGWNLALWVYPAAERKHPHPVILCHGLAANHWCFEITPEASLPASLNRAGYDVYAVDLRGSGRSYCNQKNSDFTFDDMVPDVEVIIDAVNSLHKSGAEPVWVGHSMGGMLAYAYAGLKPKQFNRSLKALVSISGPVTMLGLRHPVLEQQIRFQKALARFDAEFMAALFAPFLGRIPTRFDDFFYYTRSFRPANLRRYLVHGTTNIAPALGDQLLRWIKTDSMSSLDGSLDYSQALKIIKLPALFVTGIRDNLCPPWQFEHGFNRLKSRKKEFHVICRAAGFDHDYGHAGIIMGKDVAGNTHRTIIEWLEKI